MRNRRTTGPQAGPGSPAPPAEELPEGERPAFSPRGRTMLAAMWYGLIDGTRFGVRWAWRRLVGPPED